MFRWPLRGQRRNIYSCVELGKYCPQPNTPKHKHPDEHTYGSRNLHGCSKCCLDIMQLEALAPLHTCCSLQSEAQKQGIWRQMTHSLNSLVCSGCDWKRRVWVGCGKCVSGPDQYVKTPVLICLLCWKPDSGAHHCPGACQSPHFIILQPL